MFTKKVTATHEVADFEPALEPERKPEKTPGQKAADLRRKAARRVADAEAKLTAARDEEKALIDQAIALEHDQEHLNAADRLNSEADRHDAEARTIGGQREAVIHSLLAERSQRDQLDQRISSTDKKMNEATERFTSAFAEGDVETAGQMRATQTAAEEMLRSLREQRRRVVEHIEELQQQVDQLGEGYQDARFKAESARRQAETDALNENPVRRLAWPDYSRAIGGDEQAMVEWDRENEYKAWRQETYARIESELTDIPEDTAEEPAYEVEPELVEAEA